MGRRRVKYTTLTPHYNGAPTDWTTIKNISNKQDEILKSCESPYACGNYFYHSEYKECELCRTKDMC